MATETESSEVQEAEALRVIHVHDLTSIVRALGEAETELDTCTRGIHPEKYHTSPEGAMTYLFGDTADLEVFQHILNKRRIPYSVHPSREYESLCESS